MAWDPFASGLAREEEKRREFDPFASGAARAIEDQAPEDSPNGGTLAQTAKSAARGATAEGIYAATEGVARLVGNVPRTIAGAINTLEGMRDAGAGLSSEEQLQREAERKRALEARAAELGTESPAVGAVLDAATGYADQTRALREQIRQALPIDQAFAQSKLGQISQGLGQAAGTLPAYVVPGLGAAASVGQIYSEAYDDAKQAGADDATAHSAAMKYLPAAGLDYLSDQLVVGKILKPLKGKVTVGQVLKSIGVTAAAEGGTEGAQQAYLNQIAKRLQGYDPDRPFDQEVYDSMLVGSIVGGGVTATGSAVTAAIGPEAAVPSGDVSREQQQLGELNQQLEAMRQSEAPLPAETQPAARDSAAPSSEAKPGAAQPGASGAFDPFAAGQAQEISGAAAAPALAAVPDNLPPTPAPAAAPDSVPLTPSELMAQAEQQQREMDQAVGPQSEAGTPAAASVAAEAGGLVSASRTDEPRTQPFSPDQISATTSDPTSTLRTIEPPADAGGVNTLPLGVVDSFTGKPILQPSNDVNWLVGPANAAIGPYTAELNRLAEAVPGTRFLAARPKGDTPRLRQKLSNGRPASTISDYLGARLAVDDVTQAEEIVRRLGGRVLIDENFLDNPRAGYRARHLQVRLPSGITAELQILPREIAEAQDMAHKAYEVARGERVSTDIVRQAQALSTSIFDEAWARFQRRNGREVGPTESLPQIPATEYPIIEFPVGEIVVNKDVPQFKANADPKTGVVQKLGGKFQRLGTGPIIVWRKVNGEHEVATGRHRLDLARRSGERTIPVQIVRESDGWTTQRVKVLDAQSNIRSGQGEIKDFALYFRTDTGLTQEDAAARGLTARVKGAAGWTLGRQSSPALWDLYANNQIAEPKAVAIARGAPNHEAAQASAIRQAKNKTSAELELYARNLARSADRASAAEQMGFAGVAQDFADFEREADAVAKVQAERIQQKRDLVIAADGASRRPEAARKMGLPVDNPAKLAARVQQLRDEIAALENPDEATYQDLREAAGLPRQVAPSAPAEDVPPERPPEDPNQTGMFARRQTPQSLVASTPVYRPRNVESFMSPDFEYRIQNPVPKSSQHQLLGTTIIERRIKGFHPLWRLSLFRNAEGEVYSQVENGADQRGTGSWAETVFNKISGSLLESSKLDSVNRAAAALYAQHKGAAAQSDMFSGGETGGDTMFNLQGEVAKDYTGIVDQQAASSAARKQADQDQGLLFARRTADQIREERARLEQLRARWRAEAERIAPGLMARFGLKFGNPEVLVRAGKVKPEELTGWEQAFYDGHERLLYLFDQALQSNQDLFTRINLLHEMGHAHWDTLSAARQEELALEWEKEISTRKGPLYQGGQLRAGVAQGIERDIKEWYAERVAWANHDWARKRAAGDDVQISGPIGRAAQGLRVLLKQLSEWVGQLRGEALDVDFRRFLDQGDRFESQPLQLAARRGDFARRVVPGSAHASVTVAQRMREAIGNIRSFLQRELTSRGHLPEDVFRARQERLAGVVAVERQVQFALRDLDAAVRAVYGGWSALQPADQQALNDVLGGRASANTLDPRLRAPISTMRQQLDALSRQLVRDGVVSGDLAARVAGNIGFYLNRSYRKFDDERWAAKVPPAVLNRAATFIRAEMRADVVDRLTDRDYNAARGFPATAPAYRADPLWKQIRQQHDANQALQPDEQRVQGLLEYLLSKDVDSPAALFQPGTDGRKDLSILTRRKEISPDIRALLGEYEDARINYARSVAKMAQLLESHRFLSEAKRAGLGRFFFNEPLPGFMVRIAGEQSKALAPLNGLYTSPEVADAFARVFDERQPQNPLWRLVLALNGWTKMAKTVLHPVTQVRNFVANFGFLVANGHYHAADGGAAVLRGIGAELGKGGQAARDYVQRLARLGVVGESTAANELVDALSGAGVKMTGIEELADSTIVRAAKLPLRAAQRLYQANDEIFKIYAFENEVRAWRAALPTAPQSQIDQIAAERVRNTLPTYSLVPLAVQRIRRAVVLGSFVSFPAEIVRTGYHTVRYAMTDLASNNPAVRAIGARRLAGIALAAGLTSGVSIVSRSLAGLDDRDEEDLRRFLPSWNQNAQLLFTGRDTRGRFSVVDLSYLDPWAYLRRPVLAALRGDNWADALGDAALEASSPFVQEGVLAKVMFDVLRNQTADGRQIYNPQAGPIDRQLAKVAHLWTALEPGAVTQARRMVKAARGEISASGRAYSLEDELLALTTGARSQSLNVAQAHSFQAGRYANEQQLATTTYRRVRDRQGTVDPAEIQAARQELERVRAALFAEMVADNRAAARLGVDRAQLLVNLRAAGLSAAEAGAVIVERPLPSVDRPADKLRQMQRILLERR